MKSSAPNLSSSLNFSTDLDIETLTLVYVINFAKFALDFLFLVPYTLAILVTGPICIFISSLSGVSDYEKFRNAANKFWSIATKGTREQRILLIGSIVIIVAFYVIAVFLSLTLSATKVGRFLLLAHREPSKQWVLSLIHI